MWKWLKKYFCFHKWTHLETHSVHGSKIEPPYYISTYQCEKCGKTKSQYEDF